MKDIPSEVQKRLDGWFYSFWGFTICYYLFGISGVLCSTIAAASEGHAVKVFTVIASGCMAFVGFVQPDRQYRKYVIAWRLLDEKVNLYKHGLIEVKELLEGMAGAERALDQIERDTSSTKPTNQPQGQQPPALPPAQPTKPVQPSAPATAPQSSTRQPQTPVQPFAAGDGQDPNIRKPNEPGPNQLKPEQKKPGEL